MNIKKRNQTGTFYYYAGYFSVIGLLRVYTLIGDFYQALKSIDSLDLSKKVLSLLPSSSLFFLNIYYHLQ